MQAMPNETTMHCIYKTELDKSLQLKETSKLKRKLSKRSNIEETYQMLYDIVETHIREREVQKMEEKLFPDSLQRQQAIQRSCWESPGRLLLEELITALVVLPW